MSSTPTEKPGFCEQCKECCSKCCLGCMGSTILACFVMRSCSIAKVVREFAFMPPDPALYTLRHEGPDSTDFEIEINSKYADLREFNKEAIKRCQVHQLHTRLDETIYGFHFKNPAATVTILFAHGNAMDCAALMAFWQELTMECNVNVFALEYSGYGASTGEPSVHNAIADMEAAYDYVVDVLETPPDNIVLYGQSLGSGPVCNIAANKPCRGVVLHCALTTGLQTIFGPPSCCSPSCTFKSCDIFRNIDLVEKIPAPIFVIHGEQDQVIHVSHGRALHARSKNRYPPYFLPNGDHNDVIEKNPRQYYAKLKAFLQALEQRETPSFDVSSETEANPSSVHS